MVKEQREQEWEENEYEFGKLWSNEQKILTPLACGFGSHQLKHLTTWKVVMKKNFKTEMKA